MNTRQKNAIARLLSKLPCSAFDLTMPERRELAGLERAGRIVYRDGLWCRCPPRTMRRCERCGGMYRSDQSCGCFDNNCQ